MNRLGPGLRLALSGAAALAAAVTAWAVTAESPEAADSRARLAAMTAAEREDLLRQFGDYRTLDPADRESLRRLAAAVSADPGLKQTLDRYDTFVSGLPPWEQEELRRITDPAAKAERVGEIVRERARQESERSRPSGRSFGDFPVLAAPELDAAMRRLAESIPSITEDDRARLEALPGPQRHIEIARAARPLLEAARRQPFSSRQWPGDETISAIIESLPDERLRAYYGERSAESRRSMVLFLLLRSLIVEWQQIVEHLPREVVRSALDEMTAEERAELARRSSEELVRQAVIRHLADRDDQAGETARALRDAVGLMRELLPDRFRDRRSGGPGDGFRDGSRGGRDDDSLRDRPPGPPRPPGPDGGPPRGP